MSSTRRPTKNASANAPLPATDHGVGIAVLENTDGALSGVSDGGDLRSDLEDALKGDLSLKGKFALSETFTTVPPPGLFIEGIGGIGLPLSERDAKLIEDAAAQAPFGKRTKAVVDATVRDTFEINPDRFSFTNPAWTEFLQTVTEKMAKGLGLPPNQPPPRAELYKLLLYKTGSHFLSHKDTEKSQGTFASLIIVLQSKFEGGEVHVSHGNNKDIFNIFPSSELTTSALAWYTNVIHELKPVTSGYRLAISYNLVNASPGLPPPHLPDMHSAVSVVEKIFRKWKKGGYVGSDLPKAIVYILDHEERGAHIESAVLKGKDLVSHIKGAAERHGVSLYLGLLECGITGYPDGWGPTPRIEIEHSETEHRIKSLYDMEGDLAGRGKPMVLDPKLGIIPRDPFRGKYPDSNYGGDDSCHYTRVLQGDIARYRRSALVMSLDEEHSTTILKLGGIEYAFQKLERRKAEGPTERNRDIVRFLVGYGSMPSGRMLTLINLALEWGDFAMWEMIQNGKYTPQLSSDIVIRAWGAFTFDRTKHVIEKAIHGQRSTRAALEFILALQARVPTQDQQNTKAWLKQQTITVLSSIKRPPNMDDVQTFVSVAKSEGLPFFSQTIVKQLVGFQQIFDFWVTLAEDLWKNRGKLILSGGTPEEAPTYEKALIHILDGLIVAAIPESYPGAAYDSNDGYAFYTSAYEEPQEPQDHTRILKLLDLMVLTHRTEKLGQLIDAAYQSQGSLLAKYQEFIIPLIPELKARYQQYSNSDFPVLDAFLRAFAERWLQDLLGTPPKRLTCECQDCASVNTFLLSGAAAETFRVAQKRRSHIEAKLRSTLPGDVTLTTIKQGSPHGLQVTKAKQTSTTNTWSGRVQDARGLLALVGTPNELVRIMGERYQDVEAALAGTKAYRMGDPAPFVARVEVAPVASTSTTRATMGGTHTGPVVAGVKRKAEDEGDAIDLMSD